MRGRNLVQSRVQSLADLVLFPLPSRAINVARAVRQDNVLVITDERGKVYSSAVSSHRRYLGGKGLASTFRALVKLGKLSAEAIAEHDRIEAEARAAYRQGSAAREILGSVKEAGITLTQAQLRKLNAAVKREEDTE